MTAEENFLKQKSINQWLSLGDGNSTLFHKVVKVRNACNLVKVLKDDNGDSIHDAQKIKELAVSFYRNLLVYYSYDFSRVKACRVSHLIRKNFSFFLHCRYAS